MTIELNIKAKPKPLEVGEKDAFFDAPFVKHILKSPELSNIEKMEFIGWVRREWNKRSTTGKLALYKARDIDKAFTWEDTEPSYMYWCDIYERTT